MANKKITELELVTAASADDLVILETAIGTKSISYDDLVTQAIKDATDKIYDKFGQPHYLPNKYLGDHVTDEQLAAIRDGSFKGLHVGDYWTINNVDWLIADMDYWRNTGNVIFTKHHLAIVPSKCLYAAKMNSSSTTEGGYINSDMYTTGLNQAKEMINSCFENLVLSHQELFTNKVTNGIPTGGSWVDSTVDLMSENMVYGHTFFAPSNDGTTVPYVFSLGATQLSLFRLHYESLIDRENSIWLRDVVSSGAFACIQTQGIASYYAAASVAGVKPIFAIG